MYELPGVNPVIVIGDVALLTGVPLLGIALNEVIGELPVALGVIPTRTLPTALVSDATEATVGA